MNTPATESASKSGLQRPRENAVAALLVGSGMALGSRIIPSEEIDRAFGMPAGKLRNRAGIESLAYAAEGEDEFALAAQAADQSLQTGACSVTDLDWIIASSETHRAYPSLAAQLHSRLLARETCGALDVGGACLGAINALATAQALLESGRAGTILVATADVHSRIFLPGRVAGEFGGLFGDGASAFLLRASVGGGDDWHYRLGDFTFGCAGQYAGAIRVADSPSGTLNVHFDGDALSRAAITRLEKALKEVEIRSGISLREVGAFATHQPNPRLVALLAKQLGVSPDRFPPIARKSGNLGSSTCGAALHSALSRANLSDMNKVSPIFLASLGPGLLLGSGWLERSSR